MRCRDRHVPGIAIDEEMGAVESGQGGSVLGIVEDVRADDLAGDGAPDQAQVRFATPLAKRDRRHGSDEAAEVDGVRKPLQDLDQQMSAALGKGVCDQRRARGVVCVARPAADHGPGNLVGIRRRLAQHVALAPGGVPWVHPWTALERRRRGGPSAGTDRA